MITAMVVTTGTTATTEVVMVEQGAGQDPVEQGRIAPMVKRLTAALAVGGAMLASSFAGVGRGGVPEAAADHIIINPNTFCTWTDGTIGSPEGDYCRYWWGGYVWIYQYTPNPYWVYYLNTYYRLWIWFGANGIYSWGYY
jgi:hypothetical protein